MLTVDVFATKANTKCNKYINFGLSADPNCIAFDFFSTSPSELLNEILWIFPPKNLIDQTSAHLARYYKKHRYILVFHSFGEVPHGIPTLMQLGGRVKAFSQFPVSIVPAEKQLMFEGQRFYGFWNDKTRATKMLCMNI